MPPNPPIQIALVANAESDLKKIDQNNRNKIIDGLERYAATGTPRPSKDIENIIYDDLINFVEEVDSHNKDGKQKNSSKFNKYLKGLAKRLIKDLKDYAKGTTLNKAEGIETSGQFSTAEGIDISVDSSIESLGTTLHEISHSATYYAFKSGRISKATEAVFRHIYRNLPKELKELVTVRNADGTINNYKTYAEILAYGLTSEKMFDALQSIPVQQLSERLKTDLSTSKNALQFLLNSFKSIMTYIQEKIEAYVSGKIGRNLTLERIYNQLGKVNQQAKRDLALNKVEVAYSDEGSVENVEPEDSGEKASEDISDMGGEGSTSETTILEDVDEDLLEDEKLDRLDEFTNELHVDRGTDSFNNLSVKPTVINTLDVLNSNGETDVKKALESLLKELEKSNPDLSIEQYRRVVEIAADMMGFDIDIDSNGNIELVGDGDFTHSLPNMLNILKGINNPEEYFNLTYEPAYYETENMSGVEKPMIDVVNPARRLLFRDPAKAMDKTQQLDINPTDLDPRVVIAMALAVTRLSIRVTSNWNSDADIRAMLGLDENAPITADQREILSRVGRTRSSAANELGRHIIRDLGLKETDKTSIVLFESLRSDIGSMALLYMQARGFITVESITGEQAKRLFPNRNNPKSRINFIKVNPLGKGLMLGDYNNEDLEDEINQAVEKVTDISDDELRNEVIDGLDGIFHRPVDVADDVLDYLADTLKENGMEEQAEAAIELKRLLRKTVNTEIMAEKSVSRALEALENRYVKEGFITKRPYNRRNFWLNKVDRVLGKVSELKKRVMNYLQRTKYSIPDKEDIEYLRGWFDKPDNVSILKKASGWVEPKNIPFSRRESQESRNREIERAITSLQKLLSNDTSSEEFYFKWTAMVTGRLRLTSSDLDPQNVKHLHRFLILPASFKKKVNLTEDNNVTKGFYLAIAQAFGVSIDKVPNEESVEFGKKVVEAFAKDKSKIDDVIKELLSSGKASIGGVELKVGNVSHVLSAAMALNKVELDKPFEASLAIEIDAVTSGITLKLLQLPIVKNIEKWLARGGILTRGGIAAYGMTQLDDIKGLNSIRAEGNDTYEEIAERSFNLVDKLTTSEPVLEKSFDKLVDTLSEESRRDLSDRELDELSDDIAYSPSIFHLYRSGADGSDLKAILNHTTLQLKKAIGDLIEKDGSKRSRISKLARDLIKPVLMVFGYGAGRASIVNTFGNDTLEKLEDKLLDSSNPEVQKRVAEVFRDILKAHSTALVLAAQRAGKSQEEIDNFITLVEYYSNLSAEDMISRYKNGFYDVNGKKERVGINDLIIEKETIADYIKATYGARVSRTLENTFPEIHEYNNVVNTLFNAQYKMFRHMFVAKIRGKAKELAIQNGYRKNTATGEDLTDDELIKAGWKYVTVADRGKILGSLKDIMPAFPTYDGSVGYTFAKSKYTELNDLFDVNPTQTYYWDVSAAGMKSIATGIEYRDFGGELRGKAAVNNIHGKAANIEDKTVVELHEQGIDVIPIFDANMTSFATAMQTGGTYNKNGLEVSRTYSMVKQIFNRVDSVNKWVEGFNLEQLTKMLGDKDMASEFLLSRKEFQKALNRYRKIAVDTEIARKRLFNQPIVADIAPGVESPYNHNITGERKGVPEQEGIGKVTIIEDRIKTAKTNEKVVRQTEAAPIVEEKQITSANKRIFSTILQRLLSKFSQ
jgi:hypothetical protein